MCIRTCVDGTVCISTCVDGTVCISTCVDGTKLMLMILYFCVLVRKDPNPSVRKLTHNLNADQVTTWPYLYLMLIIMTKLTNRLSYPIYTAAITTLSLLNSGHFVPRKILARAPQPKLFIMV
jgi:hypothetical protein